MIHAKANTGTVAERLESWERRKQGIDELKDTLDAYYPFSNVILLGDFNDDLDTTIAPGIPGNVTSYINLVKDSADYKPLTLPLSRAGQRSTVSFDNVIDHQVASNEMGVAYIPGSAKILTNISGFVGGYASTTTDHYPVQARYDFRFFGNPIDVGYFIAVPWKNEVEFIWYTNHEINSNYFVVERSRNGKDFEVVDSINGKGDSREWSVYNLDMKNPWPGKSSYRLRIVSHDGTVTYSNVITINQKLFSQFFKAYSYERTTTRVEYEIAESKQGTLQMMDINGRIYFERKMLFTKGKNFHQIPSSLMPAGTYIVRVIHKDRVEASKVVLKK